MKCIISQVKQLGSALQNWAWLSVVSNERWEIKCSSVVNWKKNCVNFFLRYDHLLMIRTQKLAFTTIISADHTGNFFTIFGMWLTSVCNRLPKQSLTALAISVSAISFVLQYMNKLCKCTGYILSQSPRVIRKGTRASPSSPSLECSVVRSDHQELVQSGTSSLCKKGDERRKPSLSTLHDMILNQSRTNGACANTVKADMKLPPSRPFEKKHRKVRV